MSIHPFCLFWRLCIVVDVLVESFWFSGWSQSVWLADVQSLRVPCGQPSGPPMFAKRLTNSLEVPTEALQGMACQMRSAAGADEVSDSPGPCPKTFGYGCPHYLSQQKERSEWPRNHQSKPPVTTDQKTNDNQVTFRGVEHLNPWLLLMGNHSPTSKLTTNYEEKVGPGDIPSPGTVRNGQK